MSGGAEPPDHVDESPVAPETIGLDPRSQAHFIGIFTTGATLSWAAWTTWVDEMPQPPWEFWVVFSTTYALFWISFLAPIERWYRAIRKRLGRRLGRRIKKRLTLLRNYVVSVKDKLVMTQANVVETAPTTNAHA